VQQHDALAGLEHGGVLLMDRCYSKMYGLDSNSALTTSVEVVMARFAKIVGQWIVSATTEASVTLM
jgi:hypothetical protein